MRIRTYQSTDKLAVIQLLQLNTPTYFAIEEEEDLNNYLENERDVYFVVEKEDTNQLIGAGGINFGFDNDNTARISWDMIHPDFQGLGIGKQLTLYRLEYIRTNSAVNKIVVRTSQVAYLFYQKIGFQTKYIEQDFWAKGLDLYLMEMPR